MDPSGNLYICSPLNNKIFKVNATGMISLYAGGGGSPGDGGPATDAQFHTPVEVTGDGGSDIYVADLDNGKVRMITNYPSTIPPITGNDTICAGTTTLLEDALTGGTWALSGAPGSISPGGLVTGIAAGTDQITYTLTNSCGTGVVYDTVIVKPQPTAGSISAPPTLCINSSITVTDGTPGGVWGATSGFSSITPAGVLTGLSAGVDTITYTATNDCGEARTKKTIIVTACIESVPTVNTNNAGVKVYPNPNYSGRFTVYVPSASGNDAILTITNMLGEQLLHTTIHSNEDYSLVASEPPGVYLINLQTTEQHYSVKVVLLADR